MKEKLKKYGLIFGVMNGVGFAVAMFLACGLGSDSIGLLCDGLHRILHIGYGNASFLYNAVVIGIALLLARKNIGAGTIAYALLSGYFIDFYSFLLAPLSLGVRMLPLRFLGFCLGHLTLAFSLAVLIELRLGMNALDALLYKLSQKTGIAYGILRTITDILYAVIGTVTGGVFGVGTVISVATTGYFVGRFVGLLERRRLGRRLQNKKMGS